MLFIVKGIVEPISPKSKGFGDIGGANGTGVVRGPLRGGIGEVNIGGATACRIGAICADGGDSGVTSGGGATGGAKGGSNSKGFGVLGCACGGSSVRGGSVAALRIHCVAAKAVSWSTPSMSTISKYLYMPALDKNLYGRSASEPSDLCVYESKLECEARESHDASAGVPCTLVCACLGPWASRGP